MNILLNNKKEKISEGMTIEKLLNYKQIKNKYFAVEINEQVTPKLDHGSYIIKNGDKIEIITAIGGG